MKILYDHNKRIKAKKSKKKKQYIEIRKYLNFYSKKYPFFLNKKIKYLKLICLISYFIYLSYIGIYIVFYLLVK